MVLFALVPPVISILANLGVISGLWQFYLLLVLIVIEWLAPYFWKSPHFTIKEAKKQKLNKRSFSYKLKLMVARLHVVLFFASLFTFIFGNHVTNNDVLVDAISLSLSSAYCFALTHHLVHGKKLDKVLGFLIMSCYGYADFGVYHLNQHHIHVGTSRDVLSVSEGMWSWQGFCSRRAVQFVTSFQSDRRKMTASCLFFCLVLLLCSIQNILILATFLLSVVICYILVDAINVLSHYKLNTDDLSQIAWQPACRIFTSDMLYNLPIHPIHHILGDNVEANLIQGAPKLPCAGYFGSLVLVLVPGGLKLLDSRLPQLVKC